MKPDREMRGLLGRLEMLSHGSTQAWNKSGGQSGEPDDRMVATVAKRVEEAPHVFYRRVYEAASSDESRRSIFREAEGLLNEWTCRTAPLIAESVPLADLVITDGAGHPAEYVAQHFNLDPAFVRRLRVRRERDPENGELPVIIDRPRDERIVKAKEMRDRGLSLKQIAMHLGTNAMSVKRDLDLAA